MVNLLLDTLCLVLLCLIGIQDLKERAVSTLLFPILLIVLAGRLLLSYNGWMVVQNWVINGLFLLLQLGLLYLYYAWKRKEWTNMLGKFIGLGDLAFWLVIAVCFSPANFVLFFLTSLLFSLILHLILSTGQKYRQQGTIPLAGFQAIYLALFISCRWHFSSWEFYDDAVALKFLIR